MINSIGKYRVRLTSNNVHLTSTWSMATAEYETIVFPLKKSSPKTWPVERSCSFIELLPRILPKKSFGMVGRCTLVFEFGRLCKIEAGRILGDVEELRGVLGGLMLRAIVFIKPRCDINTLRDGLVES